MSNLENEDTSDIALKKGINRRIFELLLYLVLLVVFILVISRADNTQLEEIKERGELIVITRNASTTYYESAEGPTGFEYDLASQFADFIGVKLKIITPDSFSDIIPILNGGQADLAAAGLTITDTRKETIRFAPHYQNITQLLVYRSGRESPPTAVEDLIGDYKFEIIAESSHEENLNNIKQKHPELKWTSSKTHTTDELIHQLSKQEIDYTIVDSNEFALNRRYYPDLRVGFEISEEQQLGWGLSKNNDDSLYNACLQFFENIKENGTLTQLLERHYGHIRKFNYVNTTVFLRHIEERLSDYKSTFIEASEKYHLDWRLLAAMAYQESLWQSHAVSPTGVRGIMMLTLRTAGQLNIANRLDSRASIMGGAEYYSILKQQIPSDIKEPDHTWMTIAAYNVGFGHLEDARKLAESLGKDPHKWIDVKEVLPLLTQKKWYKKTKYGYARGQEPVIYVRNIRGYYDVLVWLDERDQQPKETFDASTTYPHTL